MGVMLLEIFRQRLGLLRLHDEEFSLDHLLLSLSSVFKDCAHLCPGKRFAVFIVPQGLACSLENDLSGFQYVAAVGQIQGLIHFFAPPGGAYIHPSPAAPGWSRR